jgi:hypothetical protein
VAAQHPVVIEQIRTAVAEHQRDLQAAPTQLEEVIK